MLTGDIADKQQGGVPITFLEFNSALPRSLKMGSVL
jgi:hypothetical protein